MTNDCPERRRCILKYICGLAILWLVLLAAPAFSQGVPNAVTYQGKLTNSSGAPVPDGAYNLTFRFYTVATGGSPTWVSPAIGVTTSGGLFTARIEGIPEVVAPGPDVYLETVVGTETLLPRAKLASAPFAMRAGDLSLPFLKMVTTSTPALQIVNYGTSRAGDFEIGNPSSGEAALFAYTSGPGSALLAWAGGTGYAGQFMGSISVSGLAEVAALKMATGANAGYVLTSDAAGKGAWQALPSGIVGTGTANYISRWSGASTLGNSSIYQDAAGNLGIGTNAPAAPLHVYSSNNPALKVEGTAPNGSGILGVDNNGPLAAGVHGTSSTGVGVQGDGYTVGVNGKGADWGVLGQGHIGVVGESNASDASSNGVEGSSSNGFGVKGTSSTNYGVFASGSAGVYALGTNYGVRADSSAGVGVFGTSEASDSIGVRGAADYGPDATGVYGSSSSGTGVKGDGVANGVYGASAGGAGVKGTSASSYGIWGNGSTGVYGNGTSYGVRGDSSVGVGIYGSTEATGSIGVEGDANYGSSAIGVYGSGNSGTGVQGYGATAGVRGISTGGYGVYASGQTGVYASGTAYAINATSSGLVGVYGSAGATGGTGVIGECNNGGSAYGVWGKSTSGYAGYFSGKVYVGGNLAKASGTFLIDHPLDPANKYLSHSFVESPDMKNIYDGNVITDANGNATVVLPDYFEALNRDFRYQLTVIGQFAQAIISDEIKDNKFTIKADKPNVKVSWQVTGIRQDAYAEAHRVIVEEDKPEGEKGYYLHPELFGQPATKSIESVRLGEKTAPADPVTGK